MQIRYVTRRTGNTCFNEDNGQYYLEEETVLQFREFPQDEWQDVPTDNETLPPKH